MHVERVRYLLEMLERNDYIVGHYYVTRPPEYALTLKGREYLINHNLID